MKETNQLIQEEYHRFIEFGNLLDRRSRRYLVEYFKHKLEGARYQTPELNDQYFLYFQKSLSEIFQIESLLPLCKEHQRITQHIVLDTLYWIRKTFAKVKKENPLANEEKLLKGWAVTPVKIIRNRYPFLIDFLKKEYTKEELNTDFYADRIKAFFANNTDAVSETEKEKFERVFTDLLSQWDALLQGKLLSYQLQKIEKEKEEFTELLEAKIEEYKKLNDLVSPLTDYLGWDMSRDLWKETSLDVVEKYNEILQNEKSLQELVDLLGEMREAEIIMEEETFEKTIIRREWIVDELAKAEIVGVHESSDLNNLLSSEVGLLSDNDTEDIFLKKYVDNQLLTFRYEDKRLVKSRDNIIEIHEKVKQKEKGPFIVLVDTSESMMGRPEEIAKVLCLGILKLAIKENRRAYLINFSIGLQTIDLYDIANSIDEVAKFLKMSFNGGTNASLALHEALRQLKTNDYQDADVLMISDFIVYSIHEQVLAEIKYFQQNKNTEFHSLTLSNEANSEILNRFDTNWIYDPEQKGIIKELTRGLKTIAERY